MKSLRFLVLDEADRMIETGHFAELDNILRLTLRKQEYVLLQWISERKCPNLCTVTKLLSLKMQQKTTPRTVKKACVLESCKRSCSPLRLARTCNGT